METNESEARQSALVTGASRGIGKAVAEALAQGGFNVCLNYATESSREAAEGLSESLAGRYGVKAFAWRADIAQAGEVLALFNAAEEAFGSIEVLVNNAGITRDGLILRMGEEAFDEVIAVNLKGTFNCCKAAACHMARRRYGRIISVGSIVGVCGNAGQANYAASKAGVVGLSKSLAKELAPRNITVNVIAPGFIETDMTNALDERQRFAIMGRIALGHPGTPKDVASLACFLAGKGAGYITGQVIGVDGGMAL
ncbi:MAG: 3-oxoacyl-[acyl-carrier-protein] reductase [Coriobacteriaceae bacterium]|nr:3-oxoacyl-[acyl-carrier-protein] reductase [Coriobacteriaceae bacterium]